MVIMFCTLDHCKMSKKISLTVVFVIANRMIGL